MNGKNGCVDRVSYFLEGALVGGGCGFGCSDAASAASWRLERYNTWLLTNLPSAHIFQCGSHYVTVPCCYLSQPRCCPSKTPSFALPLPPPPLPLSLPPPSFQLCRDAAHRDIGFFDNPLVLLPLSALSRLSLRVCIFFLFFFLFFLPDRCYQVVCSLTRGRVFYDSDT